MSNQKFGEIGWNDAPAGSGSTKNGKDTFLKLGQGSNPIRIVTLPHQYYQHKYKVEGEKGYGHRINCSASKGRCVVCDKGDRPKRRWLVGVIERKTGMYKVLDIGFSIFKGIQTYANDDDWGPPTNYDVDIVVDPKGGSTGYYTVIAKPKKPLSAADLQLKEQSDQEFLVKMSTAPEPEKVEERLNSIIEKISAEGGEVSSGQLSKSSTEDDEFGEYDASSTFP